MTDFLQWSLIGHLPEAGRNMGTAVLGDKIFLVGGTDASFNYSNKVFAADLPSSCDEPLFQGGQCNCGGGVVYSWDDGWIGHARATGTGCLDEDWIGS